MKREVIVLIFIFVLILSFNFIYANFGEPSHLIQEAYGPSENIKGWINISLDEESSNSLFEDEEGNSISLIDLIELNNWVKGEDYTCSPSSCETDYSSSSSGKKKIFNLNKGGHVIFGILFEGDNVDDLADFSLNVKSNNPESEELPLSIDFLNDGQIEWRAYKGSENFGSENFGCFKDFGDTEEKLTSIYPQCEKIHLDKTPEVEIGAYVSRVEGTGEVDFIMSIKNYELGTSKTCIATTSTMGKEKISCIPEDFSVNEEGDYFVCIKTKESKDNGNFSIASETTSPCGFFGESYNQYTYDFEIFARPKKYASLISFTLNDAEAKNSLGKTINLENIMSNYISQTYQRDCSEGCIVPIKILSGVAQQLNLSNLLVSYISSEGYTKAENLYDVSETPAKIISGFQKLYIDKGNFSVPDEFGDYSFSLSLRGDEIFSEDISVEKVAEIKDLKPRTTAVAYPTTFEVIIEQENITKYKWEFGDGKNETSLTSKIIHTYNKIGKYKLKVTVTDSKQRSYSKIFEVDVGSAKDIINTLLKKSITNLNNINIQIKEFPSFTKNSLESVLDLFLIESKIEEIQKANASATSEEDYSSILLELLDLDIPESIAVSTSANSLLFYPSPENINLDVLSIIGGGSYEGNDENYINAIFEWDQTNIESIIDFNEISAIYENSEKSILKTFDIKIDKINETSRPYFILKELDDLKFKEDYSERSESGYVYIVLTDDYETISFSTTEDINFVDLPLFISPAISGLSLTKIITEKDEQLSKLAFFILVLVFLIIIGIIAYIILQEWYKKKYESYLFKNRNDLYNLISYVQSSKKRELKEKEVHNKLRKAGWKSEQINYVMKKYAGKRTGMPEIPIGNLLEKLKKKENVPPGKPMSLNKNFGLNPNKKSKYDYHH